MKTRHYPRGLPPPRPGGAALVTGASSGIGRQFARKLAARGHDVVVTARNEAALERLVVELRDAHGVQAEAIRCDLSIPHDRHVLTDRVSSTGAQVDILINNAGFGGGGPVHEFDGARAVEMLRTNVEAVFELSAAYTPGMVQRGAGAVVIVSSLAGILRPPVNFAAYGASKAAALRYAVALHYELRRHGVAVTALCPGPVETGFGAASGLERTIDSMPRWMKATTDQCVEATFAALRDGKPKVVPNLAAKIGAATAGWMPDIVAAQVLPRFFRIDTR